jgi:peptidoglycan/LPS O-acetylase OafA/YrhL
MRFFAFLCVFFHHTLSRSSVGTMTAHVDLRSTITASFKFAVSLFFLLSGYLITTLLTMEKESSGRVHLGAFYKRRIARIWPLYYGFVVLVMLVGVAVPRVQPSSYALAAFTFFSGNWYLVRGGEMLGALGILWSVNIEEQFYLVWPVFTKYCDRRRLILLSIILMAISYAVLLRLGSHGSPLDSAVRFNTLVEMQFFAAGSLLAAWLPRDGMTIPAPIRPLLGLLGLFSWAAGTYLFGADPAAHITPAWWMPCALYAFVLAGCFALFFSFFGVPRQWLPRPILWLGKISYGLYVYHVLVLSLTSRWLAGLGHTPAVSIARLCIDLLLTILLAGLSYRWLERPFLRWKESITFVPNRRA